jgi:hypothetical protein
VSNERHDKSCTYRARHIGILKSLPDEITTLARDMRILAILSKSTSFIVMPLRTCFPKIICKKFKHPTTDSHNYNTYHEFTFACHISLLNTHKGVIILAFAEGCAVDVGREEAH